jgi:hypothetical protein
MKLVSLAVLALLGLVNVSQAASDQLLIAQESKV